MATVHYLGFLEVRNFNCRCGSEGQSICTTVPNFRADESNRSRSRYGHFSIFHDGGRPPSWICFTRVWTISHKEYLLVFVTVQNLVRIGAVVSIICMF